MKTLKYLMMMLMGVLMLSACSDDDEGSGSSAMTINAIYLEDVESSVPDREVTFARLGQLIRIEGSGFKGLQKIYVNGYDTYFNNALYTDNNVWVTLDSDTPIADAEDSVRNTIQLVKKNSSITYEFTVRAAAPSITNVDNTLPQAGELVTVTGTNLQEITSITLPGGIVITEGIESDEDGEWFTFTMPSGVTESGCITCEGANGTAQTADYFNNFDCYIINFEEDGHGVQGSWSATFSADDLVDDPLNSGRGKVVQLIPESYLEENGAVSAGVSNIAGWWTAGNDESTDDWTRMTSYIDASTAVGDLALQFDIYCPEEWNLTGQLEITLQNNLSNYGWGSSCTTPSSEYYNTAYAWVPWMDETTGESEAFTTGEKWITITVPLTKFGNYSEDDTSATLQTVITDRNSGSYRNFGFLFCNSDVDFDGDGEVDYPASACSLKVYLDNFRIVPNNSVTVSDYPEDE